MKPIDWNALDRKARAEALRRPATRDGDLAGSVSRIMAEVRHDGDAALRRLTERYDGYAPDALEVPREAMDACEQAVAPELLDAIDAAIANIEAFHEAGKPKPVRLDTAPGLRCEARWVPLSPVGLYIPGGSAPLISTVLMLAVPARIAGCGETVLCTPPGRDGSVNPAVLAAARRCGIERVLRVGGAQAVAAMAYGTESVPRCVKIFGPGNAWVTEAKRQAASDPEGAAQDMPAGPSEVLVIADRDADPVSVCWDLLSQAEHGPDSQVILLTDSDALIGDVGARLPEMARKLPRAEILATSIGHARLVRVRSMDQAVEVSNAYAPEHLILNCADADALADRITTAGSIFVGPWTPESLGDYCSGTNHVLPTYGYARAYSGLSVADFMRRMTLQRAEPEGLEATGPVASQLAAAEGLDAHRQAVDYRLSRIRAAESA